MDGRKQSVRLTLVQNPSPVYACCSYSGAPSSGHWVAISPASFSPTSVVVDFSLDAGVPIADSGTDSISKPDMVSLDADKVADRIDTGVDVPPVSDAYSDAYVVPTDEQTCVKSTNVPRCGVATPYAAVSATDGQALAKVEVTAGACSASSCASECSSISVYGTSSLGPGATCDFVVTATDGRKQSLRLTAIANPASVYTCCGYPLAPYTGQWVSMNPTVFSPSPAVVDFSGSGPVDAGPIDAPHSD
jgi:hypothetical protein